MQLEHQITEYRLAQNKLAAARERYQQGSSSVNDLSRELAQVRTTIAFSNHLCTANRRTRDSEGTNG